MKTIKALLIAVMILTSLWAGIGIGITSADSEPAAEVRSIGENRKGGVVVIRTIQENVTNWGDYIIVKGESDENTVR